MDEEQTPGERVRGARRRAQLSVDQVGERIRRSPSSVRAIENGQNGLRGEVADLLAPVLGVTAAWLLTGSGPKFSDRYVPIVGRVGADTEGTIIYALADETDELVPIPPGGTDKARALKVVGHSMGEWAPDGALIYFEDQRNPPTPDLLGYPCAVETEDGRVLLKRLLRGSSPGLYDLESRIGPTLENVRIRWAAEVTAVVPPRQARRIIRGAGDRQVA